MLNRGDPFALNANVIANPKHLYGNPAMILRSVYIFKMRSHIFERIFSMKRICQTSIYENTFFIFFRYMLNNQRNLHLQKAPKAISISTLKLLKELKNYTYSGSKSTCCRVASAICEMNMGPEYFTKVCFSTGLYYVIVKIMRNLTGIKF